MPAEYRDRPLPLFRSHRPPDMSYGRYPGDLPDYLSDDVHYIQNSLIYSSDTLAAPLEPSSSAHTPPLDMDMDMSQHQQHYLESLLSLDAYQPFSAPQHIPSQALLAKRLRPRPPPPKQQQQQSSSVAGSSAPYTWMSSVSSHYSQPSASAQTRPPPALSLSSSPLLYRSQQPPSRPQQQPRTRLGQFPPSRSYAPDSEPYRSGRGDRRASAVPTTASKVTTSVGRVRQTNPSASHNGEREAPTKNSVQLGLLDVSETVIGYGSHGTVVYQGSLQGRKVAVKRMLNNFTTLARREIELLKVADDHPNVIRYHYYVSDAHFLYIALDLCPASLADTIERPHQFPELAAALDPKRALREIASGLQYLHALKIVHRDIKPANVLVGDAKKDYRMLISDFGLCRKLEHDQSSFLPTASGAMGAGTFGWRAPEVLRGDVKLDTTQDDPSMPCPSGPSAVTPAGGPSPGSSRTRLTRSVDIFALGCLFYYCLTRGEHPFGVSHERETNIIKNIQDLRRLKDLGEEGIEAEDLITKMLAPEAADRPNTTTCLMAPYFWDDTRRLHFLLDVSDYFEPMRGDSRNGLEIVAHDIVGDDWITKFDPIFVHDLRGSRFRSNYDSKSVQDLLRALRNKCHHYHGLPDNIKECVGSMPEGYLAYFTSRFPRLFLHAYRVIADSDLRTESVFRKYFSVLD